MARTEGQWKKGTASVQPIADLPILLENEYLNFGGVVPGDLGYGFRDNNGVMEFKNEDGVWISLGSGGSANTFETVSKNLNASGATLAYIGDNLTSITYLNGVIKTLNYTGGNLTSVVLSGNTPSGINLTKILTYTGDNLTGVVYS